MKYTSLLKRFLIVALVLVCNNIFAQNIAIGTIPKGDSIIVQYSVIINAAFIGNITKQQTISGSNFTSVLSNDPKTVAANDATVSASRHDGATTRPAAATTAAATT